MKIVLIRHGPTEGNLKKRYIGRTDEPLSETGIKMLRNKIYPRAGFLFVSPMKRCKMSAEIIYPLLEYQIIDDFRECDFGKFEGRNYYELSGDADYQAWIDSGGTARFPSGEAPCDFKARCVKAFNAVISQLCGAGEDLTAAFIIHGGTIMSILERYEAAHDYYRWQCKNGGGYIAEYCDGLMNVTEEI